MTARYSFLSWARRGIGARIASTASPAPLHASVALAVHVNATRIDHTLVLHGPSDVHGIDPRAIVRTDPRPGTTDFEPNYLAAIELFDEDLPWRYTPLASSTHELRPWIALVVLAEGEFAHAGDRRIRVPDTSMFPVASQVWAWAHVHANVDLAGDPSQLDAIVRATPEAAVARLLAPRRLQPNTRYTAFVIPTFESGRCAALDLPPPTDGAKPAWGDGQDLFPTYYAWSFATAEAGDFESLVRLLEPRPLDARVGLRDLDVTQPGLVDGITNPPVLGLPGALRAIETTPTEWPRTGEQFPAQLDALIDGAATRTPDPMVAPPIYGQWHANVTRLAGPTNPPWLVELDHDPRHRVAAGCGAEVVRREQEALVDSAWDQLGAVREANKRLVLAQLAREIVRSIYTRHVKSLPRDRLLQLTTPLHARVRSATGTVYDAIRKTAFPAAAVDRAFRRIARTGGPLAKRFRTTRSFVSRIADGGLPARAKPRLDGAIVVDSIAPRHVDTRLSTADAARFRDAARAFADMLKPAPAAPAPQAFAIAAVTSELVVATDPTRTIVDRIGAHVKTPSRSGDALAPIAYAPRFDQPMYRSLAALSADFMLPNVGLVPQNTIALLRTNNSFIEAFLVGLNHEMARELLWREYPTDQRGTYFRRFWDSSDSMTTAQDDIRAIHEWTGGALGDHVRGGERLVLLVRGDLLKKYPNTVIYAADAKWPPDGGKRALGTQTRFPQFHAKIDPDLTFLGFDLPIDEARGTNRPADNRPGWFFVLEERPGEPRFGLDEPATATTPAAIWDDLTWANVDGSRIDVSLPLRDVTIPDRARWGATAADLASILYQDPVRIAVHASEMLP